MTGSFGEKEGDAQLDDEGQQVRVDRADLEDEGLKRRAARNKPSLRRD